MNLKNLILKIKNSDPKAFDLLFYNNYESLCNYAFSIIKDSGASEDIVQDFFVKIWVNRANLTPSKFSKSYIFRSVYNSCLDYIKHQSVRGKYQSILQASDQIDEFQDSLEGFELMQQVELAIQKLPDKCREVFCLSRFEGLKYKEIAARLNISENTVDTQIRRALQFLRDDLKQYLILFLSFYFLFF